MGGPLRVGVVGAGKISGQYSETLARQGPALVTAVADLDFSRAEALAAEHPTARAMTLSELIDEVDVVLNLTVPAVHAEVALAALAAGKHVYGEKPLAATGAEATAMIEAAASTGVRLACAPDTVLGTGLQTARAVLDNGAIGVPHAATAFMTTPGHERWHPAPEFYYGPGGGPLLDMGPYYLSALVHLLGPVRRVTGLSSRPRTEREIGSGPRAGTTFEVTVDTHETGLLEHESGALTTLIMSFDTWAAQLPHIEVYGSAGSLSVPDPNQFTGDVCLWTAGGDQWQVLTPEAGFVGAGRGIGLFDLAGALDEDRPHRASAELARHVLDVMESVQRSARTGVAVDVSTTCERPERVPGLVDQ